MNALLGNVHGGRSGEEKVKGKVTFFTFFSELSMVRISPNCIGIIHSIWLIP